MLFKVKAVQVKRVASSLDILVERYQRLRICVSTFLQSKCAAETKLAPLAHFDERNLNGHMLQSAYAGNLILVFMQVFHRNRNHFSSKITLAIRSHTTS